MEWYLFNMLDTRGEDGSSCLWAYEAFGYPDQYAWQHWTGLAADEALALSISGCMGVYS